VACAGRCSKVGRQLFKELDSWSRTFCMSARHHSRPARSLSHCGVVFADVSRSPTVHRFGGPSTCRTPRSVPRPDICPRTPAPSELGYGYHHHHQVRVASDGRSVVAPPCPRSTARLQRSPIGRVESFLSWSGHLFRGRPGGRRHVQ